MVRSATLILMATVLLGGCTAHHHQCADRQQQQGLERPPATRVAILPARHFAPGLIFDRSPSRYPASSFAWRSDWPSTEAYYQSPEMISYAEHFYDLQGLGFPNDNYTYREFDTVRVGAAVR